MNNNSPASACSIEYKGRDAAFMKRFILIYISRLSLLAEILK